MSRPTTPEPKSGPNDLEPPSTPGADITLTLNRGLPPRTPGAPTTPGGTMMRVQRRTPIPSTPRGHRRIASIPRTPGSGLLSCSSSPTSFASIKVHTAKCSECDQRNLETMLRCPGCTFQVCTPCRDRREAAGRSLAHGNMMTPRVATPGSGGSVVRRKPVSSVKNDEGREAEKREIKSVEKEEGAVGGKADDEDTKGMKRMAKPAPKLRSKVGKTTPSDDLSDNDFALDPASPTASKRRRTELTAKVNSPFDMPSPFLKTTSGKGSEVPEKALDEMTTDELLAHHGVNTPQSPYKAHLLSRHEPVISNPIIEIPEVVKRGFKPRPTAEEIQQKIQDKVREKMGLGKSTEEGGSDK